MSNLYASETFTPDALIAGLSDVITEAIVIASGEGVLPRGAVLGQITVGGEYALVNKAGADDGRRTAHRILCDDVDATDEAVTTAGYRAGEFNENALIFGGTDDADDHRATLSALGIILRTSVER
jgi:hypothetical protein